MIFNCFYAFIISFIFLTYFHVFKTYFKILSTILKILWFKNNLKYFMFILLNDAKKMQNF